MKYILPKFVALLLVSCLISCEDKPATPQLPSDGRTVLSFMLANNNLNSYAKTDINEMESAWNDNLGGKLYVLFNTSQNRTVLYQITHDNDPAIITSPILKEYPSTTNPCDPAFLRQVFDEVVKIAPAKSYGLFLWSHGSGWLPKGSTYPLRTATPEQTTSQETQFFSKSGLPEPTIASENDVPKDFAAQYSFGANDSFRNSDIEMYALAEALDGLSLEYIYFDACHMASVEALYALRNCAKYTISSAAETLATGAPYVTVTPNMFGSKENTITMAREFYNDYLSQSGFMQSGTISVVENKKIEAVAANMKTILTKNTNRNVPFGSIQQYGRNLGSIDYRYIFYDLDDFANKTWGSLDPINYANFKRSLNEAVIYQASTPVLFNQIKVQTHCGLTTYIPQITNTKTLKIYREKYQWATDSGLGNMVE